MLSRFSNLLQIKAGMYKISVNDYQSRAIDSVLLNPGYNKGILIFSFKLNYFNKT